MKNIYKRKRLIGEEEDTSNAWESDFLKRVTDSILKIRKGVQQDDFGIRIQRSEVFGERGPKFVRGQDYPARFVQGKDDKFL